MFGKLFQRIAPSSKSSPKIAFEEKEKEKEVPYIEEEERYYFCGSFHPMGGIVVIPQYPNYDWDENSLTHVVYKNYYYEMSLVT